VEALPDKAAVIVPAEKFPEASRATIVLTVFAFVAVVLALAIVPDVMLLAFSNVRFAPETAPNNPDHVPEVIVPTLVSEDPVTPAASVEPVNVPAAAVTVMLADPLNETPLIVLAV
jgi:hypothetical protein